MKIFTWAVFSALIVIVSSSQGLQNHRVGATQPYKRDWLHPEVLVSLLSRGCQGPIALVSDHSPTPPKPAPVRAISTSRLRWSKEFVDIATVEKLISEGVDVNRKDERGATALLYAVGHATRPVIETLIKHGADVNLADKFLDTPLLVAVRAKRKDIMDVLLAHGADVNAHNRYGESAISNAYCDDKMVTALIKHGAKVDAYALTYSSYMSDVSPSVIRKLLNTGVSVDIRDDQGRTALMCAAYSDNVPLIVELLRRGANVRVHDKYGMSVIDYASSATAPKNRRVIAVLKRAGAK
jgi:ankyrin repeat protein